MSYKAVTIAGWLINKGIDTQEPITNLELNKLLYFVVGFYYQFNDESFITNAFDAWKHGPVCAKVYHKYKVYGNRFILDQQKYKEKISQKDTKYLDEFWSGFAIKHNAFRLVGMAHDQNGPWQKAVNDRLDTIPTESIKDYFLGLVNA